METALIEGLAQHLADNSIGTWSTSVPYTADQTGIYDGPVGLDTAAGIGIGTYPVNDPVESAATVGVQFTFRAPARGQVRELAEAVRTLLHASYGATLPGGVRVEQMLRRSFSDLGTDDKDFYLRTDNYYADVSHPALNTL